MKQKKFWLRGGIIGIVTLIILVIVSLSTDMIIHPSFLASSDAFQTPGVLVILIPEWFVYGAVLGWIYGKIKNSNVV